MEGDVFLRLPDFLAPWVERFKGMLSDSPEKDQAGKSLGTAALAYLGKALALFLICVVWVQEIVLSWAKSLSFEELRRFPPEDWTGYMKKYILPPALLFFLLGSFLTLFRRRRLSQRSRKMSMSRFAQA